MSAPAFQQSLAIVLPAFNEEENVERQVRACLELLDACFPAPGCEVIVVDDGSRDRTAEIVRRLAQGDPRVRLVGHERNRGYGRALATGFAAARADVVGYTDCDNQFDVREMRDAVPLLRGPDCNAADGGADAVWGFRVYRYDSVLRCLLSWTYNRLVRVLFWVRVRDVDCAFKLLTREVNDKLVIECDDFFVDTEMVARVRKLGFRSVEKGVRHYPRTAGRTSVRPSHIPRTLWTVARMWWRLNVSRRQPAPRPQAAAATRTERS